MQQKNYSFGYTVYGSAEELPADERKLIEAAAEARKNAWSQYSGFSVGAALEFEDGRIISANNQENAAYPSGLCAERVAIFYAAAKNPDKKIKALAVCGGAEKGGLKKPVPPCGACRQVVLEYEQRQKSTIKILFCGSSQDEIIKVNSIGELLPFSFGAEFL